MCQLFGKRPVVMPKHRWVDNIARAVLVLRFKGTWIEQATGRIRWRRMVGCGFGLSSLILPVSLSVNKKNEVKT